MIATVLKQENHFTFAQEPTSGWSTQFPQNELELCLELRPTTPRYHCFGQVLKISSSFKRYPLMLLFSLVRLKCEQNQQCASSCLCGGGCGQLHKRCVARCGRQRQQSANGALRNTGTSLANLCDNEKLFFINLCQFAAICD